MINRLRAADTFSPETLVGTLKLDARSLGLPEKSVEPIIARVLKGVLDWQSDRSIITQSDLERIVGLELDKYSPDLAFVYRNHGKII